MRATQKESKAPSDKPTETPSNGVKIPDRLLWITHAFANLSRTRIVNETGPQPISFADLAGYATMMNYRDEQSRDDLVFFINGLDIVYLRIMHAQIARAREAEQEKAKREASRRRRR